MNLFNLDNHGFKNIFCFKVKVIILKKMNQFKKCEYKYERRMIFQ